MNETNMKSIQLKCRLLSDIIISESNSTTGNTRVLDFIPGNCFLGIAASSLYPTLEGSDAFTLFHSGKVKFGDAHPSYQNMRGLRVPADLFFPKGTKITTPTGDGGLKYLHHCLENFRVMSTTNQKQEQEYQQIKKLQLKQARTDFYCYKEDKAIKVDVKKDFGLKSAYDATKRRAKESQMFGYTSLVRGLELYFTITFEGVKENLQEQVVEALLGTKHVGRSKSAEYGLVEISRTAFTEVVSAEDFRDEVVVYADSRLIFIDSVSGLPTFQPRVEQLGFQSGQILWQKSQVRTFQYAPWNFKRQAFDSDRCGIEKGSVFVVRGTLMNPTPEYIGSYQHEGFGKVIYNPYFLKSTAEDGKSYISYEEPPKPEDKDLICPKNSCLISFLQAEQHEAELRQQIYEVVNKFREDNRRLYGEDTFASQWGTIRSLAMVYEGTELIEKVKEFISHGVAAPKWEERGRNDKLLDFLRALALLDFIRTFIMSYEDTKPIEQVKELISHGAVSPKLEECGKYNKLLYFIRTLDLLDFIRALVIVYEGTELIEQVKELIIYREVSPKWKARGRNDKLLDFVRVLITVYEGTELIEQVKEFISHGVAAPKWKERGRNDKLLDFMEEYKDSNLSQYLVNLCSEMGKISKKA